MSERDQYPPGVPCWVDILKKDPEEAMKFYKGVFGWEFAGPGKTPGDPPGQYFVARLSGRDVAGLGTQSAAAVLGASAWLTYISVASVDKSWEQAMSAGATTIMKPFDALPAGRMAVLADPSGAVFAIWEAGERQGAQLVNQPGAWNISTLITRDLKAAEKFYGEVFGWKADTFDTGIGDLGLWRKPGFVGGNQGQPVPRDVVALLAPFVDFPPVDIAAHWSIGFFVADVSAVVENATKLGGKIVVPLHKVPGAVNAVLSDAEGAVFSVTQAMGG